MRSTDPSAAGSLAVLRGAKHPHAAMLLTDFILSKEGQTIMAQAEYFPAHPDVAMEPSLAAVLKGAKLFPIDADYAGANRKRIVERWVAEVLNP